MLQRYRVEMQTLLLMRSMLRWTLRNLRSTSHNKPMVQGLKPHYLPIVMNAPGAVAFGIIQSQTVAVSSSGNVAIGQPLWGHL
jgi:hypothetical protein